MKQRILIIIALVLSGFALQAQNIIRPKIACPNGIYVNSYNGVLFYQRADMSIPNRGLDLEAVFYYNSSYNTKNYGYGNGWSLGYEMRFIEDSLGIIIEQGDGRQDLYTRYGNSFEAPAGVFSTLSIEGSGYTLTEKDGTQYRFTDPESKKVTQIANRYGNALNLGYENGQLTSIADINGRSILFEWNADTLMTRMSTSFDDRVWTYGYDEQKNLTSMTNPMGYTVHYAYNRDNRIKTFTDEEGYSTHVTYNDDGMAHRIKTDLTDKSIRYELANRQTVIIDYLSDGNNQFSTYKWDERGRVIEKIGNCCGFSSKLTYDDEDNVIRSEDANGHATTYTYDQRGNMLSATDALGNTEYYTYDNHANTTYYTDRNGNTYTYVYDSNGNPIEAHSPLNTVSYYSYNQYGQLVTKTDANNNTTTYNYDSYGNLVSIVDPMGNVTEFTNNAQGQMLTAKTPKLGVSHFVYDKMNNIVEMTDPMGGTAHFQYNGRRELVSVTDALSNHISMSYNAVGMTTETTNQLNNTIRYAYNAMNNPITKTDAMSHTTNYYYNDHNWLEMEVNALGDTTSFIYDNVGQIVLIEYPNGRIINYQYDVLDRLVSVSDQSGVISVFSYDANGNTVQITDGEGNATSYIYDALGRVTQIMDAEGSTEYYSYDNNGNILTYTNQNGQTIEYTYNANNQIVSERNPLNHITNYAYDANGNLASVTDARGNTTSYQYDANNQLTKITFANGKTQQMVRDANGNILTFTDESGYQMGFVYDALNRLTQKTYPNNTADSFTYDANGNMLTANNVDAQVSFIYDAIGKMLSETLNGKTTSYAYDTRNRTITKTYPSGRTITEEYDLRHCLTGIKENNNYFVTLAYNANNALTQRAYDNGTTTNFVYNTLNRLVQITDNPNIANVQMTYDAVGNMLSKEDLLRPTKSEAYTYDALNRLTNFEQGEMDTGVEIPNPMKQVQYALDALGNRTTVTTNGVATHYTADNMNAYTAITGGQNMTPQYDDNGNMTSDGAHTYQYNYNNRLISVDNGATATYTYDALNRRIQKTVVSTGSTTNYYYCGDQAIEERDANDAVLATYIFGISVDDVLQMQRDGNTYYCHKNHLGSVVALTDGSSNLVERYEYDPYGQSFFFDANSNAMSQSVLGNSILFTGRDYDVETGAYYYRTRTMHSGLGRFMQHDPLIYRDSYCLYQYVIDNPIKYLDSYGEGKICRNPIPGLEGLNPQEFDYSSKFNSLWHNNKSHLQIVFNDDAYFGGHYNHNIGFGTSGFFTETLADYQCDINAPDISNDCILEDAVNNVKNSKKYKEKISQLELLLGHYLNYKFGLNLNGVYNTFNLNCQDFVYDVVDEYNRLQSDSEYMERLRRKYDCTGKCGMRTKEECKCQISNK